MVNVVELEKKFTAKNGVSITYLEDPYPVRNYIGEQKLLIIFQSLGDEKAEEPAKRYPYTLIDGLKFFNCRKIYIKDDKEVAGDYYLGTKGKFDTKEAVKEFIKSKIVDYGILKENITTFGFSKGGYAAFLYGFELGVGNIVTAIPIHNLWTRIEKYKPFLDYILPENYCAADKERYGNYLSNVIKESINRPNNVYIITSHNDETYYENIPQITKDLKEKGIDPVVIHNDEYAVTRHNNVVINSMNEIFTSLGYVLSNSELKQKFTEKTS